MAHAPECQGDGKRPKKRVRTLVLFSLVALLGIGLLGGPAFGHPFDRLQEKLDLTDEQADQVMDLISETRKEAIAIRASIRVARIEIGDLLTEAYVDEETIARKADAIGQSIQELVHLWTATLVGIRDVVTPEQMQKARGHFMTFFSRDHGDAWRERWGERPGPRRAVRGPASAFQRAPWPVTPGTDPRTAPAVIGGQGAVHDHL